MLSLLQGELSVDGLCHVLEKATCLLTLDISGQCPDCVPVEVVHHLLASQKELRELSIPPQLFVSEGSISTFSQIVSNLSKVSSFSVNGVEMRYTVVPMLWLPTFY